MGFVDYSHFIILLLTIIWAVPVKEGLSNKWGTKFFDFFPSNLKAKLHRTEEELKVASLKAEKR